MTFLENAINEHKMQFMENRLWNERGYEIQYLNSLIKKELETLYHTEFESV